MYFYLSTAIYRFSVRTYCYYQKDTLKDCSNAAVCSKIFRKVYKTILIMILTQHHRHSDLSVRSVYFSFSILFNDIIRIDFLNFKHFLISVTLQLKTNFYSRIILFLRDINKLRFCLIVTCN